MQYQAFGLTDVGRKRDHNEDAMLMESEYGLFMVCDGMGGHAAGEVASEQTTKIVSSFLKDNQQIIDTYKNAPNPQTASSVKKLLTTAASKACKDIFQMAKEDPSKQGMGTTLVMLLIIEDSAFIAHVGDSRGYLVRQNEAHQITEDHSLVNEYVKQGVMSREEAEKHPQANLITRAIGPSEFVQADALQMELMGGDVFLLCSDGLSEYLSKKQLLAFHEKAAVEKLPKHFIDHANKSGGKDNVTAVVIQIGEGINNKPAEANVAKKVETLMKIPLFKNFDYKEITKTLELIHVKKFASGENIIEENSEGDEMFVLLTGEVNVTKDGSPITTLKQGSYFGEMALIDKAPRSATISASENSRLMVLKRGPLFKLLKKEPRIAMKLFWAFLQNMNKRLRINDQELSNIKASLEQKSDSAKESASGVDLSFLDE